MPRHLSVALCVAFGLMASSGLAGVAERSGPFATDGQPRAARLSGIDAALSDSRLLSSTEQENQALVGARRAAVEEALRQARGQMAANPAKAEQCLKQAISNVARDANLDAATRIELLSPLTTAIREAHRRLVAKQILDRQAEASTAALASQNAQTGQIEREQERLKQQLDRDAGQGETRRSAPWAHYDPLSARVVSSAAPAIRRNSALTAEAIAARNAVLAQRNARAKGYLATTSAVHDSGIPTPDDRPISYMDAPTWRQITAARRYRYRRADSRKLTALEEKIEDELRTPTEIDFAETPLVDAINYLKDLHGIEIKLDAEELHNAGISPDMPITCKVKGVQLRSALHMILRPLHLAYIMQDEVLWITTAERASHTFSTRVYYVGDFMRIR